MSVFMPCTEQTQYIVRCMNLSQMIDLVEWSDRNMLHLHWKSTFDCRYCTVSLILPVHACWHGGIVAIEHAQCMQCTSPIFVPSDPRGKMHSASRDNSITAADINLHCFTLKVCDSFKSIAPIYWLWDSFHMHMQMSGGMCRLLIITGLHAVQHFHWHVGLCDLGQLIQYRTTSAQDQNCDITRLIKSIW